MHFDQQAVRAGGEAGDRDRRNEARDAHRRATDRRSREGASSLRATGTTEMSSRLRVATSNERTPRSQSTTSSFPPSTTYSAASSHSCTVAEKPRLRSTGIRVSADFAQQRKVLHVPRADLQHIRISSDELDVARIHHFGHDAETVTVAGIAKHLERLFAEALKGVGRSARLVSAPPRNTFAPAGRRL